jgi:hypothetical protein
MTWTRVEDATGVFTLRRGGFDVGTVSFLPSMPSTGEVLHPTVLSGVVVAALNDYDATVVVDQEMRFRANGWPSSAAYHAESEVTKSVTAQLSPEVRAEIATAWARHGWSNPITPEQMSAWQDEILEIATATEHDHGVAS